MEGKLVEIDAVNYRQLFPWVHLFRAFRIAVDIRKIALAALALAALAAGNRLFLSLPFAPNSPAESASERWPWQHRLGEENPLGLARQFSDEPASTLVEVATNWPIVLRPADSLFAPASALLRSGNSLAEVAFAVTQLLWAVAVWSLFAGAITRMAAVQFARESNVGMWSALQFSAENFLSYFSSLLLPVLGIGFFWALCLVGGLVGRIPFVGEVLIGVFWFLPLLFGLVMTLVLLGVTAGWPLMFATISVQCSDGFDGFSRAYSYVYGRIWYYVWLVIVAMAYGSVVIFFVTLFGNLVVYLAGWSVAAGMGLAGAQGLIQGSPQIVGGPEALGPAAGIPDVSIGAVLVGVWLHLVSALVVGFVYSYFWTASTIIYFLLRKSDDATNLDEVYLPAEEEADELLPLVGVADSQHPVVERPHADNKQTSESQPAPEAETEAHPNGGPVSDESRESSDS